MWYWHCMPSQSSGTRHSRPSLLAATFCLPSAFCSNSTGNVLHIGAETVSAAYWTCRALNMRVSLCLRCAFSSPIKCSSSVNCLCVGGWHELDRALPLPAWSTSSPSPSQAVIVKAWPLSLGQCFSVWHHCSDCPSPSPLTSASLF